MTQRPFKFRLEEQIELFPDMLHDSTYMYDDDTLIAGTDNYWNKYSRLMTTEMIRHYEFVDSDGQRRVRKVSEKKTYFDSDEQRHNPACSTSVEIL